MPYVCMRSGDLHTEFKLIVDEEGVSTASPVCAVCGEDATWLDSKEYKDYLEGIKSEEAPNSQV